MDAQARAVSSLVSFWNFNNAFDCIIARKKQYRYTHFRLLKLEKYNLRWRVYFFSILGLTIFFWDKTKKWWWWYIKKTNRLNKFQLNFKCNIVYTVEVLDKTCKFIWLVKKPWKSIQFKHFNSIKISVIKEFVLNFIRHRVLCKFLLLSILMRYPA